MYVYLYIYVVYKTHTRTHTSTHKHTQARIAAFYLCVLHFATHCSTL